MATGEHHAEQEQTAASGRHHEADGPLHDASPVSTVGPVAQLRHLQRTAGNRAVGQWLRRDHAQDWGGEAHARPAYHATVQRVSGAGSLQSRFAAATVQRAATLQRADGPQEHEGVGGQTLQARFAAATALQRAASPGEEAQEEGQPLQAKAEVGLEGGPISQNLSDRINARRGGGSGLGSGLRTQMEGTFGATFD